MTIGKLWLTLIPLALLALGTACGRFCSILLGRLRMRYGNFQDRRRVYRPTTCHCCGKPLPDAVLVYIKADGEWYCRRCYASEVCTRIVRSRSFSATGISGG